ncbi:Lsr2 family protein [Gordonia amicalis]|uniref:histone-like nucleoid-structuring protein Lsr2 n=1 Tax=Gordonia amicalis TaxID=89053 RepID=UPI002952D996|nr:Lsr2 family protein [Gordonia amicalis]MDV7102061.1 Lsr2 family protein [Gordonia amicalis]
MSRIQTVTVVDDLDGRELDPEEAHTVAWTWLGVDYELDVSPANLDKIEEGKVTVAKLLTASTRVGGRRQVRGSSKRNGASNASSSQNAQIREWATANGFEVSPRGRIARDVVEAYEAAN